MPFWASGRYTARAEWTDPVGVPAPTVEFDYPPIHAILIGVFLSIVLVCMGAFFALLLVVVLLVARRRRAPARAAS